MNSAISSNGYKFRLYRKCQLQVKTHQLINLTKLAARTPSSGNVLLNLSTYQPKKVKPLQDHCKGFTSLALIRQIT
jgi:hypothetical protein